MMAATKERFQAMDAAIKARRARDPVVLGAVLVFLSASAFGSMVVFGRWAFDDGVSPTSLLLLRFAIAALVLAVLARSRKAAWPRGTAALVAVVMGVAYVGNSLSYFVALGASRPLPWPPCSSPTRCS
jgi:drug/metabolite transporter (DMT)-like permease